MADLLFSAQQDVADLPIGAAWDHYFPFNAARVYADQAHLTSFVVFMRYSFYRPRDILAILDILNKLYVRKGTPGRVFSYHDLFTPEFRQTYGDYLLGEIKDSLSFYYAEEEFQDFLKFFEYLNGAKKFDYERYVDAYASFSTFLAKQGRPLPEFMRSAEEFLQFLYDLNVICFIEPTIDERFIRWCFNERSTTNISPKVKINMEYEIHYGLANVLNTGKEIQQKGSRKNPTRDHDLKAGEISTGSVKWYNERKSFGFIAQEGLPVDIYFSKASITSGSDKVYGGRRVQYELHKDRAGRLVAKNIVPLDK